MSGTIVVIGDALLDVTTVPDGPIRAGGNVPARIRFGPGGQGANLAVRLARRGIDVQLVCGLGDDRAGALVADALDGEGISLARVPVGATGIVVILLDDRGERTMLSHRAPFAAGAASIAPPNATWVMVSGYLLLEADGHEMAGALAGHDARRVVLGCATPDALAAARWMAAAAAMRPHLLVLNDDEAEAVGLAPELMAGVVTTDAGGARASIGGLRVDVRAPPAGPPVDSTGAGDSFAAGLIASLIDADWPPSADILHRAMTDAVTLASAVARTPGAQGRVAGERPATLRR